MVVSTLRDEAWQALLRADGDAGDKARRPLADAHVVGMSAELAPNERAEGARLMLRPIFRLTAADFTQGQNTDTFPMPPPPTWRLAPGSSGSTRSTAHAYRTS